MSLLMLANKDGGVPIPPDPRPAPLDQIIASMRPTGRRIGVIEVAADGSKPYTNLRAACNAAATIQSQRMAAEGVASTITPNYRVDIIVHPGVYRNSPKPPPWAAIYGYGSGLVTIYQDLPNAELGTLTPNGAVYVEGVTLVKDGEIAGPLPKYPIHNVNAFTSIFADVVFDNRMGGTAYGSDGADRGYTVLYKCGLIGGVNAHGWAFTLAGQQIAFINCTANSSVGWQALNNTAQDECWVVGGSVGSIEVTGSNSVLHRDPASVVAGSITAPIQDARTDWPIPIGGLSTYDRAYYGM